MEGGPGTLVSVGYQSIELLAICLEVLSGSGVEIKEFLSKVHSLVEVEQSPVVRQP